MLPNICLSFWILVSILCLPSKGFAFDERYPPFETKAFEDRTLKAVRINGAEKGEFRDKDLTISWETKAVRSSEVDVRYKSKLVVRVELPGKDDYSNFLGEIYYVDLDGNGLSDIIIHPAFYGSGLGSFYKTTTLLLQVSPGQFRRLDFSSFYFDPRDFIDLKGDGRYQLLIMQLADSLPRHNFWVYVPYEIKDFNLRMDKKLHPDFPKFIWYTEKPNSKPTDKLTQKQKNEYLKTLPLVIKSHPEGGQI